MKIKSEKGSITLLVLTSCLFFVVAVTTVGMHLQAKQIAVDREYKQIKENYEKDVPNIEAIYDELKQIETMPVRFSIPEINESEKNIKISFSLHNPNANANINTIRYGWLSSEEEITPNSSNITNWVYLEDKNSENTVVAKREYTDDIDYYYLCVMINNKEFWSKAPVKVSADASYYGDQIDYDIDLGNNADDEPLNIVGTADYDWEIFYNDGTNIFIIAEDYVPLSNPLMPTNMGNDISRINTHPYSLFWSSTSTLTKNGAANIFGNSAPAGTRYIANKFLVDWKQKTTTSTASNARVTAVLMDTNTWEGFSNSTQVTQLTDKVSELLAIGSPTIEMWIKSWNKKYEDIANEQLYIATNTTGYFIGDEENPTSRYTDNNNKRGYNNKMFYPRTDNYKNCSGYRLTSPSAYTVSSINGVSVNSKVGDTYYSSITYAIRPVICLPSDITAEWDENNNVWKIIKKAY